MAVNNGKEKRVLAAVSMGVETVEDIEVELDFELTRHQIAGHIGNLKKAGKILKTGEYIVPTETRAGRQGYVTAHRYAAAPAGDPGAEGPR